MKSKPAINKQPLLNNLKTSSSTKVLNIAKTIAQIIRRSSNLNATKAFESSLIDFAIAIIAMPIKIKITYFILIKH